MLSVDLIDRESEFDALEGTWNILLERCKDVTVFQTFEWNRTYWRTRVGRERLCVIVLRDGHRITGIAPLILGSICRNCTPFRKLDILGYGPCDRLVFLFPDREEEHVQCLVDYVFEHLDGWSVFTLGDLIGESPVAAALLRTIERRGCSFLRLPDQELPYVDIHGAWEDYYAERFSAKQRARDRALRRNLEKRGSVEIRLVDDLSLEPRLIDRFLAMPHHDANRGKDYRIPFAHPINGQFFRDIAQVLAKRGMLRAYLLELSGTLIAYRFGFEFRHVAYDYFTGFDPTYRDCGPGRILLNRHLRDCFERGLKEFHFLRGAEAYKLRWANGIRRNLSLLVFPPTFSSMLLRWGYDVRNRLSGEPPAPLEGAS